MKEIIEKKKILQAQLRIALNAIDYIKEEIEKNKSEKDDYCLMLEMDLSKWREIRDNTQKKIYTLDEAFDILNEK